jgi:hypothetical protein
MRYNRGTRAPCPLPAREGALPEVAKRMVVEALTRAAGRPDGLPLFAAKAGAGLFAPTAAGKLAARHCHADGLLRVVRREPHGKAAREVCDITDKGLTYLLEEARPPPVLDALVETLHTRQAYFAQLAEQVRRSQEQLAALEAAATHSQRPAPRDDVVLHLAAWHDGGALGDCPLPELFRRLRPAQPALTIGQFHDRLRVLHQDAAIYLHPWTGPLHELPEPAFAFLVGHEIAYYASLRV